MKLKKYMLVFISIFLLLFISRTDRVYAAEYDDPVGFYNKYGNSMQFIGKRQKLST